MMFGQTEATPTVFSTVFTLSDKMKMFCREKKISDPQQFDNLVDFVAWIEEYDKVAKSL